MKQNIIKFVCAISMVMGFSSCEDELDIVPKGKTTLENVADLEALLNTEYALPVAPSGDISVICNEALGQWTSVDNVMSQKNTVEYANMAYDESVDRATLTVSDARYNAAYKYINYMNVIISKMGDASGDAASKAQYIAEARIIRAYMHWLMVNIYAKQYDEATAAQEGGIPYVDNTDVSEEKTKLSLAETYERILDDCSDEVIASLQQKNSNVERVDQAVGNAVRAKVLMQMKRYSEALPYAQASIRINGTIEDRSTIKTSRTWNLAVEMEDNLLFVRGSTRVSPTYVSLSVETSELFEPGDYVVNYDRTGWQPSRTSGIAGSLQYRGWSAHGNPYGITSDRMYYTAAECLIRTGQIRQGLEYVDRVRAYRVENFEPFAKDGMTEQQAMALLQKAKWIECIDTYENFFDCKRWNTETNYRRTITKSLGSYGMFSIAPDSKIWVLPFPSNATRYNPSLTQNY